MKTIASADMNVLGGNVWVQTYNWTQDRQFTFLKKNITFEKEQKVD